jgi:hypothetical protein
MLTKTYDRNITRDAVAEVRANARETREVKRAAREEKDWVTIIYIKDRTKRNGREKQEQASLGS